MPASKLAWPSLLASLIRSCGRVFRGLPGLVSLAVSSNDLDLFAGKRRFLLLLGGVVQRSIANRCRGLTSNLRDGGNRVGVSRVLFSDESVRPPGGRFHVADRA